MDYNKLYNSEHLKQLALNDRENHKKCIKKIKAKKPKQLDSIIHNLHHEKFEQIYCLKCANCCKGLGPRITDKDIERLAKFLRLKQNDFIAQYLRIDEDNDYVFKEMPCPFLAADNYCMVYEQRPKACREYPHTDTKKMIKHLNLALKNTKTCPAVYLIIDDLSKMSF